MKQFKLTLVLTVLMSMVGLQAFADWDTSTKVQVDGLYYYLDNDNNHAMVTNVPDGENKYAGDIVIPASISYNNSNYYVTEVGGGSFYYCSGIKSIKVSNEEPMPVGSSAFDGAGNYGPSHSVLLYVPKGSKEKYAANNQWNIFKGIREYASDDIIDFADENVKSICVSHWDTNGDGELSENEAAAATTISNYFANNSSITSFDEFAYFINLESLPGFYMNGFRNCNNLTSITIPYSVKTIDNDCFKDCSKLTTITVCSNDIASREYSNSNNFKTIFGNHLTECIFGDKVTSIGNYALWNCSGLTSVIIPNSVTNIGESAFRSCLGLTSITIPNSVTNIGDYAFSSCLGLTSVTIPNSVTSIGDGAFRFCSGLTSIAIPNSVTSIGSSAFESCSGLTSVTIPNSVTSIGGSAFQWCSGLTSLIVESGNTKYDSRNNCNAIIETASNKLLYGCNNTIIPNSVTSIGDGAFGGCSGLTSVTIPNSVTNIGESAFRGCEGLASINVESGNTVYDSRNNCNAIIETASNKLLYGCNNTIIPNSVTSIDDYAFCRCSGLTSVTIPNSVTSIGDYAFPESGLTSVTIGNSVTSIGDYAFAFCLDLTSVTVDINTPLAITSNTFDRRFYATLYVPAGSKSAYEAADYWKEFKEIVEMPDPNIVFADANVKEICVAHWDTNNDGELSYDEAAAVTTISDYFKNNTSITSFDEFTYFTGVTSIDDYAFVNCTGLTSITIPNNVTSIGTSAFNSCSNLASITIPNSVTSIDYAAFRLCSGLTSVTFGSGLTSIGIYAFDECSSLASVTIGSGSIGNYAFKSCSGLTSVTFGSGVTSIGDNAFDGCTGLTSVSIPNSVTYIGVGAFDGRSDLTSMIVESGNTQYDSRNNCNAIIETASNTLIAGCKNTVIPNSVTNIGSAAFRLCSGLTSVTIPNSVTNIGINAFDGCTGLTSVSIPNSVTSIRDGAFLGCTGLTSVTVDINSPLTITDITFSNRANATLYVPAGCKSAYEAADYWKEFGTIEEMNPGYVTIAMNAGTNKPRSMVGYSSEYGLDFTGITGIRAYIVCGFNFKKEAMLVHVNVVPPYTGFVIKTTNSSYDGEEFVVPTSTDDYYYANLLLPVVESQTIQPTETIDDVEYTNLMVGILNNEKPGFVRLTEPVVRHNKSYLRVPTSLYNGSASARQLGGISMVFEDDEATGISNLNDNVNDNIDANAPRYNIAGQRVDAGYKGVVIQNGKKILIK